MPYRTVSQPNDVRRRRLIQSVPSHCCPVTEGPPLLFAEDLLLGCPISVLAFRSRVDGRSVENAARRYVAKSRKSLSYADPQYLKLVKKNSRQCGGGRMPENYFWRSGREKCFSLVIPLNRTFSSGTLFHNALTLSSEGLN
jgi:hypothetical protein